MLLLAETPYPIMIGLYHQIKKQGYILVLTKGKEVRKHFAVLDQITQQLIFYGIFYCTHNK